jgi:hypothetical protein
MPHFGTNVNHKCVNMQTIYYASIAKPNLNSFEYVFAKQIKVHQFIFLIVSLNCPKMLKNRLFLPESPLFKAKKLSKFVVIGPKIIDNDTGKFVRLSAFR